MAPEHEDDEPGLRQALAQWCLQRESADWSAADEARFQRWLGAGSGRRASHARWQADWARLDTLPADAAARLRSQVALDRAEALARASVGPSAAAPSSTGPRRREASAWVLGAVGAIGAVAVPAAWWLGPLTRPAPADASPPFAQAYRTGRGELTEVELPDGSRLQLDSRTELWVRYDHQRRDLLLQGGQAAFTVVPDAARPFRATAGAVSATALGTRYALRHTPDIAGHEHVEVRVESGRVRVAPRAPRAPSSATSGASPGASALATIELVSGQGVAVDAATGRYRRLRMPPEGIAPRDLVRSFSDVPLSQALAEMSRHTDLGLDPPDPLLAALRLSGTFDLADAATTRRLLARALSLHLGRRADGRYRLQAAG